MHFLLLVNWMQKVVVVPTLREEAAFCGVVVNWRAKSTFRWPECSLGSQGNLDIPQTILQFYSKKTNMIAGISTAKDRQFLQSLQLSSVQGQ